MLFGEPSHEPMWPPRPGLLITLAPEYVRGINFNEQENWSIEEWRAYARYLEEKGQQFIAELKRERDVARIALTIKERKASRRKKKKYESPKDEMIDILTARTISHQRGGLLTALFSDAPLINGASAYSIKPKRGRPKSENLQSVKYARLVLRKKAELETQGNRSTDEQALEAVCEDLNLSRMQRQLVMSRKKTIFNNIPKLRRS
ncbi:hypothetical protein [Candidatus Methylomicrobium oryzae]|uniref:hypothetical protein n=1 Tax=Candidatus Methylomicrobium oryzae TaxID=2802053 RepID=UPI001920CEDC|nr:hypothetical protein [Methylomicrobium sp. RS1]MBL1264519.1 hypothetical protein [Methylomicrobium sp. RS1]